MQRRGSPVLVVLALAAVAASVIFLAVGRHRTGVEVALLAVALLAGAAGRRLPGPRTASRAIIVLSVLAIVAIAIEPHVH